jgi:hypothetical protein
MLWRSLMAVQLATAASAVLTLPGNETCPHRRLSNCPLLRQLRPLLRRPPRLMQHESSRRPRRELPCRLRPPLTRPRTRKPSPATYRHPSGEGCASANVSAVGRRRARLPQPSLRPAAHGPRQGPQLPPGSSEGTAPAERRVYRYAVFLPAQYSLDERTDGPSSCSCTAAGRSEPMGSSRPRWGCRDSSEVGRRGSLHRRLAAGTHALVSRRGCAAAYAALKPFTSVPNGSRSGH